MRGDFRTQPELAPALFRMLDKVFPGIAGSAERIRGLGVGWEACSTPFVRFEGGDCLSHVGLIPLDLVLDGRPVSAGTVHAVATDPDARGRGHYRGVMQELLAWAGPRFGTLVLTTEHPEYFEPFGFRHEPEHMFGLAVAHPGGSGDLRPLAVDTPADLALLHRLLESREPVSYTLGVRGGAAIFCFNEGHEPLWYSASLDTLLRLEVEGRTLRILDVVAPVMPSWSALLAVLPWPIDHVSFDLCPDRLAPEAEPRRHLLDHDGPSWLMVRGDWLPAGTPFTLPRSART